MDDFHARQGGRRILAVRDRRNSMTGQSTGPAAFDTSGFLSGGGAMAELIRSTDWSTTSLGAIETWPQSLRTTVSLCLASNFPINIIWGPEHCQIYNDGYRVVCGDAHPSALGEGYHVTWASAWPQVGEPFNRALAGETSFLDNQRMFLFRNGYLEESFFTFSLSPIRDESGGVGGVFLPVVETTATSLSERRTRLLRDLNARLGEARAPREIYDRAIEVISGAAFDLPFALLYALSPSADAYHLAGHTGCEAPSAIAPTILPVDAVAPWPVKRLIETQSPVRLELGQAWPQGLRAGPYDEPPKDAAAFAITVHGAALPAAILVIGLSPRLPLDEPYRDFCSLLASTISAGLANAKTYEDQRQRAEALAALDRAKTTFFSNVSHEFRTPLTLMLGPIEDALDDAADLPNLARERLEVARNALRLLKLVNSLLDFSRIEAGRTQARLEPTDLAALTAELASNFRSACERAGLELVVDCPPLPELAYVDRDMWEKVVLNLLSNAFKFTLRGRITVSLHAIGGQAKLVVADTGVGIAEDELPRVFERFHRIEGQNGRTHEGTGIGLALVQELVKLHGGAVQAQSDLGQGSAFQLTVPLGRAHLTDDQILAEPGLAPTAIRASDFVAEALRWLPDEDQAHRAPALAGSGRVVLADDNADMRDYVKRLLQDGGYEVEAVGDGRAALEAIRRGPRPDLVLSDVMMTELDGFGLLAALRADPQTKGLLVMLLSARAGEEARVEGLAAGADDYLVKPFGARELRARIDGAVRLARQRDESAERERNLRAEIATERDRAALRQTEQQLAFALQAGRMGSWELDVGTSAIVASPSCRTVFGLGPDDPFDHNDHILALVHPDDREPRQRAISRAVRARTDLEIEFRIVRPDGQVSWVLTRGQALYENDRPTRFAGVCLDITARKAAEEHQRLLLNELNHRVKNTLATVQSLALQTRKTAADPGMFNETFLARIYALAGAHELLTEASWEGASLIEVVQRTLRLHLPAGQTDRIQVLGPTIRLGPNAAVTLNMAFHELATNAVKYGALSNTAGRVSVDWTLDDTGPRTILQIDWRESGGPPVAIPTRRGFGSRLIERGLPRELDGEGRLTFSPDGLACRLRLPLSTKLSLAA
jgi:PAS domain S-box-containing protein